MATPDIVTGDSISLAVTLYKGSSTFVISGTAVVKAMLVSTNHRESYSVAVTQSNATSGADFQQSLVVVVLPGLVTQDISYQGPALLEIQVSESGVDKTWFVGVNIVTGRI
jgi:hypothetical protein